MISLNKHYDAILSLTTHSVRTKNILRTLLPILKHNNNIKVVLTLFYDDYQYLTNDIFDLIHTGYIELNIVPINLYSHLKYFFTAVKYSDAPIILIDDDIVYPDDFIDELLMTHTQYPKCILSRRPEKITFKQDGTFLHYHQWLRPYFNDNPTYDSLATGVGGILFPENFFNLSQYNINEILSKCAKDDDVYLKVLSIRQNVMIKSVQSKNMYKQILDDKETQSIALCNTNWNRTITSFMNFSDEVLKLKELCLKQ